MTQADHANAAPAREQPQDENKLIAERREKLKALRERQAAGGAVAFPNDFKPQDRAAALRAKEAPFLSKLRGHFAEFLNNSSLAHLRILSSSTCVGLRYGHLRSR